MSIFRKIANTATDYGKTLVKAAVIPTEFVTQKAVYTPKYKTNIGTKLGSTQGKISGVTMPIMVAVAPKPVQQSIKTVGSTGSMVLPDKKPVFVPVDVPGAGAVPKSIPVSSVPSYSIESPKLSKYDKPGPLDVEKVDPEKLYGKPVVSSVPSVPSVIPVSAPVKGLSPSLGPELPKENFNYKPLLYTAGALAALYGLSKL
jgi:hypothetical protein